MKNRSVVDRISEKLIVSEKGCWEFPTTDFYGYGQISYKCKSTRVHRLVWELNIGSIPKGLCVLHKCDNRACCNPEHLFLGTHKDNVIDMINKGRDSYGENKGERNGQSKLCVDDIIEIKKMLDMGYTCQEIADNFNVSRRAIGLIRSGERWRHIL